MEISWIGELANGNLNFRTDKYSSSVTWVFNFSAKLLAFKFKQFYALLDLILLA